MDYSMKAESGTLSKDVKKKRELTQEDKELLMKNIRPKWMEQEEFKRIRRQMKMLTKHYLKQGRLLYKANEIVEVPNEKIDKDGNIYVNGTKSVRKTYPPYVKPDKNNNGTVDAEAQGISK